MSNLDYKNESNVCEGVDEKSGGYSVLLRYTAAKTVNTQITRLLCTYLVGDTQNLTAVNAHQIPSARCSFSTRTI